MLFVSCLPVTSSCLWGISVKFSMIHRSKFSCNLSPNPGARRTPPAARRSAGPHTRHAITRTQIRKITASTPPVSRSKPWAAAETNTTHPHIHTRLQSEERAIKPPPSDLPDVASPPRVPIRRASFRESMKSLEDMAEPWRTKGKQDNSVSAETNSGNERPRALYNVKRSA